MTKFVLDASAVLALLFAEPGGEKLTSDFLEDAAISTVNLAEVQTRLVRIGDDAEQAWADASAVVPEVHPFTVEQARIAGNLVISTRPIGLSLGDRACLALAITLKTPVYTTDRLWKTLNAGVDIRVLR